MIGRRRSLTIREENDKKIQHMRSQFLYYNIDIDYTTMTNIFIELGDTILKSDVDGLKIVSDIFKKYVGGIDNGIISLILKDYQNKNNSKEDINSKRKR